MGGYIQVQIQAVDLMGSVCTLLETRMTFWLRDWDSWNGKKKKCSFIEGTWIHSTSVLVLRCGRCGWDVVRSWDTVVDSTHIFKVLNEGESKLRQQSEVSVMLILVIKAHIHSIQTEKSSLFMECGNGSYCNHHGLFDLFFS